jgi:hypothetical protein
MSVFFTQSLKFIIRIVSIKKPDTMCQVYNTRFFKNNELKRNQIFIQNIKNQAKTLIHKLHFNHFNSILSFNF